ncbi:MAG: hypothetical protein VKP62_14720 [Candidatus Sericytochromatia bacterium]|nr:hypothetical protein [Candidatus Sericytochromatia bacterium]
MKSHQNRALGAGLCLALSLTLPGCAVPNISTADAQNALNVAAKFASVGLKVLDDAGIETPFSQEDIQSVLVNGQKIVAAFDEAGNLKVPVEAGKDAAVEVQFKDGQSVKMPVNVAQSDFDGGKTPQLQAYVMPGSEDNQLLAEVGRANQSREQIFDGKTVVFDTAVAELTNENAAAYYIGPHKSPRQSWWVKDGNLHMHASNLFLMMQAQAGQAAGPGATDAPAAAAPPPPKYFALLQAPPPPPPGGMQPPPPGGAQPGSGAMPPPPPGGAQPGPGAMQPPPPGGAQPGPGAMPKAPGGNRKVHLTIAAKLGSGIKVWTFTPKRDDYRLPGPPPVERMGMVKFQNPPKLNKTDYDVREEVLKSLAELEARMPGGPNKRLPPAPTRKPGGPGAGPVGPGGGPAGPTAGPGRPGGGPAPAPGGAPAPAPGGGPAPAPGGGPAPAPGGGPAPAPGGAPAPAPFSGR